MIRGGCCDRTTTFGIRGGGQWWWWCCCCMTGRLVHGRWWWWIRMRLGGRRTTHGYIYIYVYFLDIFITWSIDLPDRAERSDDYLWLDGPILFLILI